MYSKCVVLANFVSTRIVNLSADNERMFTKVVIIIKWNVFCVLQKWNALIKYSSMVIRMEAVCSIVTLGSISDLYWGK